jgi:hypothetical protein
VSASPFVHLFQEPLYQIPVNVIVVISKPWEKYSAEEKALLAKILGSVKIELASVRLLVYAALTQREIENLAGQKVLIFGTETLELKPYENIQAQGFTMIKADDLSALDDAKKKSLWLALRNMFGI